MRVALVTAGGSGMGAAAAPKLAEDGFVVGILSSLGKGKALGATLGVFGTTGAGYITGQNLRVDGGLTRSI